MNKEEFLSLIHLYKDVQVNFSYEANHTSLISIDFYRHSMDQEDDVYCEIVADWWAKDAHIHHVLAMKPQELLKVSYVMQVLYQYLTKGKEV